MTDHARVALYQRVSVGVADAASIQQQNTEGQVAVARRAGWHVVATYQEAVSASRFAKHNRPEWLKLMADVRLRKFDVIVLWEPSRGDRKLSGWVDFIDACRDNGVKLYITKDDRLHDPANHADYRALAYDGIDSHSESEKISDRAKRGIAGVAANGEPHGVCPYGYRRYYTIEPGRRKPVPHNEVNPETAPIRREIITRIAASEPVSAILRDLNARGVPAPNGGKWARSTITHLVLEGEAAIGKRRYNGQIIDGTWKPIVTEDVFYRAVNVLRDPARKRQAEERGGIRPGAAKWLLSYIATCAKCGHVLNVQWRPVKRIQRPYYRCLSSKGGCAMAPVEWLDTLITEAVIRWASQPGVYGTLTRADDKEAEAARLAYDAEKARLDEFEAKAIAGTISADSFARVAAGIRARLDDLDRRAKELAVPPAVRDLVVADSQVAATEREEQIRTRWVGMPLAARRNVVRAIFTAITLAPVGPGGLLDPYRVKLTWSPGPEPESAEKAE